ncbi:recombinase family protein [Microvirga lotononidis]|uniref:Site-specific recombinase, DNA invertase Pin n=1 Tax=Microvirga lotononidis TaxID=864069 RepID=I4YRS9_9HYPH|nr:recombinase family protein [Microvirga lotononidis]EIM26671.1 site-specific recombinase, DNA invertase Pin [Microvirga lotononidis]WQO32098.1 recombinase family protein [Microvirga lotononidis]
MFERKFVAYYRVSTEKQGRSGLGLEAQQEAVRTYLRGGDWQLMAEVVEVESGKKNDRPRLAEALRLCRLHGAVLIIAKLDRLARNVAFISNLMESGVEFTAVDFPQANRLTVHILAAVAEHEREMISKRTKDALAAAKARGKKLGGNRGKIHLVARKGAEASALVRSTKARRRAADIGPIVADLQANGTTSLRQIAAALNERHIKTSRGKSWTPTQVMRVMGQSAGNAGAP